MWRLWSKALGTKEGDNDKEADKVALLRTAMVLLVVVTNVFIMAGVVHQW